MGPASGSAWEEKMQAGVTQFKTTWAGPEMEELNAKKNEAILWEKKK